MRYEIQPLIAPLDLYTLTVKVFTRALRQFKTVEATKERIEDAIRYYSSDWGLDQGENFICHLIQLFRQPELRLRPWNMDEWYLFLQYFEDNELGPFVSNFSQTTIFNEKRPKRPEDDPNNVLDADEENIAWYVEQDRLAKEEDHLCSSERFDD